MSCKFCDLDAAVARNGGELEGGVLVGEWTFTKDDDLIHHSQGRVNLWFDFEDNEWSLLVLIDDDRTGKHTLPATAMFHPKVCPMCGRRLGAKEGQVRQA